MPPASGLAEGETNLTMKGPSGSGFGIETGSLGSVQSRQLFSGSLTGFTICTLSDRTREGEVGGLGRSH